MAICRVCGRKVAWRTVKDGKILCNAAAIYFTPVEKGGMLLITKNGELVRGIVSFETAQKPDEVVGYIPHWVTCLRGRR